MTDTTSDRLLREALLHDLEAYRPALQTVVQYALQQSLIPRKIAVEELFDATTADLSA